MSLAESIPGLFKRLQISDVSTKAGGIDSLEWIPGLLKRLQIRALMCVNPYLFSQIQDLHYSPTQVRGFGHTRTTKYIVFIFNLVSLESIVIFLSIF